MAGIGIFSSFREECNPWMYSKRWSVSDETKHLVPGREEWKIATERLKWMDKKSHLEVMVSMQKSQSPDSEKIDDEKIARVELARKRAGSVYINLIYSLHSIGKSLCHYKYPTEESVCLDDCLLDKFVSKTDYSTIIEKGERDLCQLRVQLTPVSPKDPTRGYKKAAPVMSYEINEHQHRYLYQELHLEVIDMLRAIGYSLDGVTSTNQITIDTSLCEMLASANYFVEKLKSVIYVENNMELIGDEIVFGRILPFLWAEFNDKNDRYRFASGYNVGEEVRQQASNLAYRVVHKVLMKISSIYTILCLDYITIIDDFKDIERSVLNFRDKLEKVLQMGNIYFLAMSNRDEVFYALPNAPKDFNSFKKHGTLLKNTGRVCNDIQSVLVIAHTLKLFYDTAIRVAAYEVPTTTDGRPMNISSLRMDQKIYVDSVINEYAVRLSGWRSMALRSVNRSLAADYVNIPVVQQIGTHFVEDGTQLQYLLMFGTQRSESGQFVPATLVLGEQSSHIPTTALESLKELVIPPQLFSVDVYELKSANWSLADEKPEKLTWGYQPLWRFDLIKGVSSNGFVGLKTVIELQILESDSKNFWENNAKVRNYVLEQFALGVVVKDNAVRHRKWRNTNLARSLQSRRFLECKMDNFFVQRKPPAIPKAYFDTLGNLSSRLFWFESYRSNEVLKILFPVPWWDIMVKQQAQKARPDLIQLDYKFKNPVKKPEEKRKASRLWIRGDVPLKRVIPRKIFPLGKSN